MKKILGQISLGLLALGILGLVGWGAFELFSWVKDAAADSDVVVASVIATAGVVLSALTAIVVKNIEKTQEVDAQFREKKFELFLEFLRQFDKLSMGSDDDLVVFLKDFQRRIVFWGSPNVLKCYFGLRVASTQTSTVKGLAGSLTSLSDLILAMRKDLGLSNGQLDPKTFGVQLILKNSALMLKVLKENPKMSVEEFARLEKADEQNGSVR